jgi:tetratricopeptide (TPR) repeat protein
MRRLFEQIRKRVGDFLEQRDDVLLVVRCGDSDVPFLFKLLQELDESDGSDLFWLFNDEQKRADEYVGTVVQRFEERHRMVCDGLAKNGRPPWPPLPDAARKVGSPPAARARALIEFSRSLLPSGPDFRVVWAFLPLKLGDPAGQGTLFEELLRTNGPAPWYHHVRIVAREDPARPALKERLAKTPRVAWYEPEMGIAAQEKSLEEDVTDQALPVPQRMQSLLLLAGTDYAHRRYADALKKYDVLLSYYQRVGNRAMVALVLNGMGEVHQRSGNPRKAKVHYESALSPAIQSSSQPVLLNVTLNLANLALSEKNWKDGESYYDSAEKLATAQLNAPTKIHCLENRGICLEKLEKPKEATESWEAGATLAKATEEKDFQKRILERLKVVYDRFGQRQKLAEVDRELVALRARA